MRVTRATTQLLRARREPDHVVLPEWARCTSRPVSAAWPENPPAVLSLHTDEDITGRYGPISPSVARIIMDQIIPAVTGQDLTSWRWLEDVVVAGRHHHGAHYRLAWSAVELAAWDARGIRAQAPVASLLGSALRPKVPVYASALGLDIAHPESPNVATWLAKQGYYGQKWQLPPVTESFTPRQALRLVEGLCEAAGQGSRVMIDARGLWDQNVAHHMIAGLAGLGIAWVEEPTALSQYGNFPALPAEYHGFIAAGEHAYELAQQLALVAHPSIGIIQPDIAWQGGFSRALILTTIAKIAGKPVIPHGASFIPGLILGAAAPMAVPAVEYHLTLEPVRQLIYKRPVWPEAGYASVPQVPGLGLEYLC